MPDMDQIKQPLAFAWCVGFGFALSLSGGGDFVLCEEHLADVERAKSQLSRKETSETPS